MNAPLTPDYVVWGYRDEGGSCMLDPPTGYDDDWEFYEGIPMAAGFPPGVSLRMSDDHKRNVRLTDNIMNLGTLIVASERLTALLQAKALKNVEFLPVTIINHKRRVASRDYSIVHPVMSQDCLDLQKSGCTYSNISPGDIISVDRLVLDAARIDPNVAMFRIKDFGFPVVLRRELAEEIQAARLTSTQFRELDEYGR